MSDRREQIAKSIYGRALFIEGYAPSPEEGERHWGALTPHQKARYRKVAGVAQRILEKVVGAVVDEFEHSEDDVVGYTNPSTPPDSAVEHEP